MYFLLITSVTNRRAREKRYGREMLGLEYRRETRRKGKREKVNRNGKLIVIFFFAKY